MRVRAIEERDVAGVIDLYRKVYGANFPFQEFYDPAWVKRGVFDDRIAWAVAEMEGRIVGSAAVMLAVGDHDDLIGEFGRLVVDPECRRQGIGRRLGEERIATVAPRIEFGFAEARTAHTGAQRILLELDFRPVGFEPMKYVLTNRESFAFCARLFGNAAKLRKNNPEVIKEVFALGAAALGNLGFEPDLIVKSDGEPYPTEGTFDCDHLEGEWAYRLLRIEQGRVAGPEVFGGMHLDYGYLKVKAANARYLVCRERSQPVGAVGFIIDDIDRKARVFELIGFDDAVKGALLKRVTDLAEREHGVAYIEVDVSAYAPRLQRTLDLLGYVPVSYCPAMVFHAVERLDVVKMAKLVCPYEPGELHLLDECRPLFEIVDRSMRDKKKGVAIDDVMRRIEIFDDLSDMQIARVGRICTEKAFRAGDVIFGKGSCGEDCYVITRGAIEITDDDPEAREAIATIEEGEIFGEFALIDALPRSMAAVCRRDATALVISKADFESLMRARPDIGTVVYRNISRTVVGRLRTTTHHLSAYKRRYRKD